MFLKKNPIICHQTQISKLLPLHFGISVPQVQQSKSGIMAHTYNYEETEAKDCKTLSQK